MRKLLFCLVAGIVLSCSAVSAGVPKNLRCEYQSDPLGLDMKAPRLSWWLDDSRIGAKQTAYQVLVASTEALLKKDEGDLWDSGKVDSDVSIHVPYNGKPLQSRQQCFWKIKIWDKDGKPSKWSDGATWEMALLNKDDWKAQWIVPTRSEDVKKTIPLGPWLWHPTVEGDNTTVFFRTEVELPAGEKPHFTIIAISADNHYELFVNGKRIGEDGNFKSVEELSGDGANFKEGKNLIAVKVKNADGPAGLIMGIQQNYFGGRSDMIQPTEWVCSDKSEKDWNKAEFKTEGWVKPKVIGKAGDNPWGSLDRITDGPRRSVMMRDEFDLPAKPVMARVYVTGLGYYKLHINGERVSDDVFSPGWTQYEKRLQYQVYDVTELLKKGRNAVGAILGNGWWSSGLGWDGGKRHCEPGEDLRLLVQLEIECKDGSRHVVTTGPSWTCHDSPIVEDTLYNGEKYDARLEQPGWDEADFKADGWKPVKKLEMSYDILCAQREPSILVTEELVPVKITEPKTGIYVLDFGQNHSGRPKLTVKAEAGAVISMLHGEFLNDDGTVSRPNYRSAQVTDIYTCKGDGTEIWEPVFTYRGFRYIQVTGLPFKPGKKTIISRVLHSAPAMAGTFECSNELLNRILCNTKWGQRSNMHSVPTDCPQRDERLGWMGDAQAFAPTSIWNMDMALFYTKWMRDILQAQQEDGAVPGVCPTVGKWVIGPGRSAWADAIMIIPWDIYLYYGDTRILEENYEGNGKWVEFMRTKLSKDGMYEQPTWGDWVPVVKTPELPIAAMFGFWSTRLYSEMAKILGKADDARKYAEHAEAQRVAFNAKYLDKKNNYIEGTQTANILPLAFGITDPDKRQAVADNLAADVKKKGGHHSTGFLGTPLILPILAQYGYTDLAYGILNTKEYPSLGYMIDHGATAIWERWNSDKEGPGMNSRNHFAFGSMSQWLFEGLAGLNPDPEQPGFKHIIVKPCIPDGLAWVSVSYPTRYGELSNEWTLEKEGDEDELEMNLTVPANTTATVYLPAISKDEIEVSGKPVDKAEGVEFIRMEGSVAVLKVLAGTYEFESRIK